MLGIYRENGEEHGNFYILKGYTLVLYRDDGNENGNYYLGYVNEFV